MAAWTLTEAQLAHWIAALLWPAARTAGLFVAAPLFGNRALPARVKAAAVLALAGALAPLVPQPSVHPASVAGMSILVVEFGLGLTLGLALRVAFAAVDLAGELAGLQMGLGFATFFDPQSSASAAVLAQLLGLIAALIFFALDGHLLAIALIADSFERLPPGSLASADTPLELVRWGATVFEAGLLLALPVVGALLLGNLALGALARAVPQLGLFAIGFPLQLLVGLALLAAAVAGLGPPLERLFEQTFAVAARLVTSG